MAKLLATLLSCIASTASSRSFVDRAVNEQKYPIKIRHEFIEQTTYPVSEFNENLKYLHSETFNSVRLNKTISRTEITYKAQSF